MFSELLKAVFYETKYQEELRQPPQVLPPQPRAAWVRDRGYFARHVEQRRWGN